MSIEQPTTGSENEPDRIAKEARLEKMWADLEEVADAEGHGVDAGIKETVAVVNALGFPTAQSCEGHVRTDRPYPWVRIAAPDEPPERYVGQNELFNRMAQENGVLVGELKRGTPEGLYWQVLGEVMKNGETEEYLSWREKNNKLHKRIAPLVGKFNEGRVVDEAIKLECEDRDGLAFEIRSEEENTALNLKEDLPEEEEKKLTRTLALKRIEMESFTQFLKKHYFSMEFCISSVKE